MNIDRIVLTTFPGYFFTQILSLRSIQQYAAGFPIDVIIDDIDLRNWPTYVEDCQQYINQNFPGVEIAYHKVSDFNGMYDVKPGGWFRQQLVKLYLDYFVPGSQWLLVDADVCFEEPPKLDRISATTPTPGPIEIGNRKYVGYMLICDTPWIGNPDDWWCFSSVPFRPLDKDLLVALRRRIESLHGKSVFDLHMSLFETNELVAYDPEARSMIMSEFQLIEVFRHRYTNQNLPIGLHVSSNFSHTSSKDWSFNREWFEQQHVIVPTQYWNLSQAYGKYYV